MGHKVSHFFKDTVGGNINHGFRSFGGIVSHAAQNSFHTVGRGFSSGWHSVSHGVSNAWHTTAGGFNRYVIHPTVQVGGTIAHVGGTVAHTFESLHPLNILKQVVSTAGNIVKGIVTLPLKLVMPHPAPKRNVGGVHPTLEESNHLNSNTTQEREMLGYAALIAGGAIIIYLVM
jgi:hypothetical protein